MALNGWHRGERLIHEKVKYDGDPSINMMYTYINNEMPDQHIKFHTTRLPFVPVTILDKSERPWGSILAGRDGNPGFISYPHYSTLAVDAQVWEGDPLYEVTEAYGPNDKMLIAGIGIEFTTRRRNKFAGKVAKLNRDNDSLKLQIRVNEAIGNCPKYITIRDLIAHPTTSPKIAHRNLHLLPTDRLPDNIISFIHEADTVFFGTVYRATSLESRLYPSHLGMNQRGGRPGFIRVSPSDGRTVNLPDFSGNRILTSLGNVEATPYASLTFVSFTTGDVLYLTGDAKNIADKEAQAIMPFQNLITSIYVTGCVLVRDALPVRQRPNTTVNPSPYSPPIRYLAEETPDVKRFDESEQMEASLTKIVIHSPSLATFTWETPKDIQIKPGQTAVLDFTSMLGSPRYQHMAPSNPSSINDNRIRTWTVSSASSSTGTRTFALTMRQKEGGVVTGMLFTIARKLQELRPEALEDVRALKVKARLVGISGDFVLPGPEKTVSDDELGLAMSRLTLSPPTSGGARRLLWIAGGIGITPFLSMLNAVTTVQRGDGEWDIKLVLSTREPAVLLGLVEAALQSGDSSGIRLSIDVFSNEPIPDVSHERVALRRFTGRLGSPYFDNGYADIDGREMYVCGPPLFEKGVLAALVGIGVDSSKVLREGFEY